MFGAESLERFLRRLFDTLQARPVKWCVLRNYQDLPRDVGNDLDLAAAPEDLSAFIAALRDVAQREQWLLVRTVHRSHYHGFYLCRDLGSELVDLHVDVWTMIGWRGVETTRIEALLAARAEFKGIPVASHGYEAAVSLLKELLQLGAVKDKGQGGTKRRIQTLVAAAPNEFRQALAEVWGSATAELLMAPVVAGEWATIDRLAPMLRQQLVSRRAAASPLGLAADWGRFGWGHLSQRARSSGVMLCFVGPDGAGKSTIADGVQDKLAPFFAGIYRFHGRPRILPPAGAALVAAKRLLGKKTPYVPPRDETHRAPRTRGAAVSSVILGYYSLDYLLSHPRTFRQRHSGILIVADRYYYDYVVSSERAFGFPERIPRSVMALLPQPDLTFFLRASPDRILARKPELTRQEIERQNAMFGKMAAADQRMIEVDADRAISEVVHEISVRVLQLLAARSG